MAGKPSRREAAVTFDYEDVARIEGRGELDPRRRDLAALRLVRALEVLPSHPRRILEVGCGAGRYLRFLEKLYPGTTVVGCDISFTAVKEAASLGSGGYPLVADAMRLPFKDGSFDVVLAFDVFEHLQDPELAMGECRRVMRSGGLFHSFIPCECNPRTLFRWLKGSRLIPIHSWKFRQVGHIQCFTASQVIEMMRRHGLHVQATSYSFHVLGQVFDVVDYWRREKLDRAGSFEALVIKAITKPVLSPLWRLVYYEAQLLRKLPWAVGLHVTARA